PLTDAFSHATLRPSDHSWLKWLLEYAVTTLPLIVLPPQGTLGSSLLPSACRLVQPAVFEIRLWETVVPVPLSISTSMVFASKLLGTPRWPSTHTLSRRAPF